MDPFAEGREAFDAGKTEDQNPYDTENGGGEETNAMSWNDGWNTARDEADEEEE